jgi:methyl-galactoside transport system substrate-binding protein
LFLPLRLLLLTKREEFSKDLASYDQAYCVGTDSKESGIIQGKLIAKHWAANPKWDLNGDGVIQYVLLKGEPGHPAAEVRSSYVISTLNSDDFETEMLHLDTGMAKWLVRY